MCVRSGQEISLYDSSVEEVVSNTETTPKLLQIFSKLLRPTILRLRRVYEGFFFNIEKEALNIANKQVFQIDFCGNGDFFKFTDT